MEKTGLLYQYLHEEKGAQNKNPPLQIGAGGFERSAGRNLVFLDGVTISVVDVCGQGGDGPI